MEYRATHYEADSVWRDQKTLANAIACARSGGRSSAAFAAQMVAQRSVRKGQMIGLVAWNTAEAVWECTARINLDPRQKTHEAIRYWNSERRSQCGLLRDVFGNPFRPVRADRSWLHANAGTVFSVAQAIYEEKAFDRLPILGDALEDAGCTDAAMLDHCRQPGEHVRGCWAVDLVLQKK